ncbi:energy transducer TonB [Pseudothauera rhizosphaerae]|uniref:energy transducer TonB n=1 Tax=Pseudothauera rhizosphaerae TaxID=2565932 RepID=UPI001454D83B|nr:energy transducer TonB [Pseudothauera rhizosphaerae]
MLPPLQWGWLALVVGVHAAGLAWLGLGGEPALPARPPQAAVSVRLLAPSAPSAASVPQAGATPPAAPAPPPAQPTAAHPRHPAKPAPRPAARPHTTSAPTAMTAAQRPEHPPAPAPAEQNENAAERLPTQVPPVAGPPATETPTTLSGATPGASHGTASAFSAARFDAAYLHNPEPAYPQASRRRGEEGQVVLRVRVLASGRAGEVEIAESSRYPRLDHAARQAVAEWRFEPAHRGDVPVDSWLRVPAVFRLEEG